MNLYGAQYSIGVGSRGVRGAAAPPSLFGLTESCRSEMK